MKTSRGDINLKLFENDAPLAVASFVFLARKGYYNGLTFHRVIKDPPFMAQAGCPRGTGSGDPQDKGIQSFEYQGKQVPYPFADEFKSGRKFDKPGILAMANAGPRTNGSQFFITHVPTPHLNNKHTIFGEVEGPADQKVVNAIKQGDKILSVTIM
ncbi:MAG: peptidyl-prolyl cis-trans isomerase A PpiA [Promethearchaeota archaeon CR_4]|nr:MAG: peptidyl-prolyl cis-trans isomerase A PpiA [Candidatus Lokiarchaeota archaeon CR_4]